MITALLVGSAASSALVVGALIGSTWSPPKEVTGVLLAFASGAPTSALAFELSSRPSLSAAQLGQGWASWQEPGFSSPSTPRWIDTSVARTPRALGVGWALLAAVTLDGIPENLALETSLVEGTSLALLVAILSSNLPEALAGAIVMRREGRRRSPVIRTWLACGALLAIAVLVGFARGAVLASLADTLMPRRLTTEDRSWSSRRRPAFSSRSSWPRE